MQLLYKGEETNKSHHCNACKGKEIVITCEQAHINGVCKNIESKLFSQPGVYRGKYILNFYRKFGLSDLKPGILLFSP